ncbi:cytochrome P450 [Microbispora bryophytorum]|uniref:cytochrome P450 n=1 Tax=Microbispora bryophytorum TaxID=1460882 RepID=UPI003721C8A7
MIATKRSDPGDDMTSFLIAARDEESAGAGFTDQELRDTLVLMINAGCETTVNVIDQAVFAMLTSPDRLRLVSTLFERFPAMSLAVPAAALRPIPTLISNGHRELPVHLRAVE